MKKKSDAPKHLKADGRGMWKRLQEDFDIDDAAGLALLQAACEAHERSQGARRAIARYGAVVKDRFGQFKAHPSCGIERDARGQMIAALRALRLAPEDAA